MDTKEINKEAFEKIDITKSFALKDENTSLVEQSQTSENNETESKKEKKVPFNVKMGQFIYLSLSSFSKNNLWESASSCSFGFVFSFLPIALIILTVLFSVLRNSPNLTLLITDLAKEVDLVFDLPPIIENLLKKHRINALDFVLGVWVIWMARKLFLSIIQGMARIFGEASTRKSWFNQLLTFISEFALVFIIAGISIFAFTLSQVSIFSTKVNLPKLFSSGSGYIVQLIFYFVLFVCIFLAYKYLSGTKPDFWLCVFFSALCCVTFFIFSAFLNAFINKTNYNILYGTLSTLILMMVKVYFFFLLFLFFAQMIYVAQFFDQLLKSQLYFLPSDQDENIFVGFIRVLFVNPSVLQNEDNTIYVKAGEQIFAKGENVKSVYYLRKGIIKEKKGSEETYIEHGVLIGDTLCILNEKYTTSAFALTDCEIVEFPAEEFMRILEADSKTATLAVSKVFDYTSQMRK